MSGLTPWGTSGLSEPRPQAAGPLSSRKSLAALGRACLVTTLTMLVTFGASASASARSGKRSATAHANPAGGASNALAHRLASVLGVPGSRWGALVTEVKSGSVLFSAHAETPRAPASVEKLYTSVAALNDLGANTRFATRVFGVGGLGAGGVWHGNLYLRGGGDPTFGDGAWNRAYEGGHGPTAAQVAAQLQHAGIHAVRGHIFADESLFDTARGGPATHNHPDIPDYGGELSALVYDHGMTAPGMSPAVFAAHELALTLRSRGVSVAAAGRTARTPARARLLAQVRSPKLSVLLRLMDVPSDDLIADLLAKQLGARLRHRGTLAAGAAVIHRTIVQDYELDPTIYDGSGLDHADRTSPAQIVSLLRKLWSTPTGNLLYAALPVVGRQGTVRSLGAGTQAQGHCVAKTGTLNDVTNLAGYCAARRHHLLAFALMLDGPPNGVALARISRAVTAIADY